MQTPLELATSLEQSASLLDQCEGSATDNAIFIECSRRMLLASSTIRELSRNQLPPWESINVPSLHTDPRDASTIEKLSQNVNGVARDFLQLAAGWIKLRDQEIADLRGKLAKSTPPPGAFHDARVSPQEFAQREHWRAMEHQTRRIADANALRALSVADQLETREGRALTHRVLTDAEKA